jgi:hypothetical protein
VAKNLKQARVIREVIGDDGLLSPSQAAGLVSIMERNHMSVDEVESDGEHGSIRRQWKTLCVRSDAAGELLTSAEKLDDALDDPANEPIDSASFDLIAADGTTTRYDGGEVPDGSVVVAHILRHHEDGNGLLMFRSTVPDPREDTHMAFTFVNDLEEDEPENYTLSDPRRIVNPIRVDEMIIVGRKARAKIALLESGRMHLNELNM